MDAPLDDDLGRIVLDVVVLLLAEARCRGTVEALGLLLLLLVVALCNFPWVPVESICPGTVIAVELLLLLLSFLRLGTVQTRLRSKCSLLSTGI